MTQSIQWAVYCIFRKPFSFNEHLEKEIYSKQYQMWCRWRSSNILFRWKNIMQRHRRHPHRFSSLHRGRRSANDIDCLKTFHYRKSTMQGAGLRKYSQCNFHDCHIHGQDSHRYRIDLGSSSVSSNALCTCLFRSESPFPRGMRSLNFSCDVAHHLVALRNDRDLWVWAAGASGWS